MSGKNFISMDNVVSGILLEIGDEKNRQYFTRAYQWALDEYRSLSVHQSPFYLERRVQLDDIYSTPYPDRMVELLSVGVYLNGEFWPFTRKPNMSLRPLDEEDEIYEEEGNEIVDIPSRGFGFADKGSNIGYFQEDPEGCRIFVRNYRFDKTNNMFVDNTSRLSGKVIVRYKTDGLTPGEDMCIPYEYRELIIALVTFRFMRKNIPVQYTNYEKDLQRQMIDVKQEEFNELTVGIKNFWEVKDAIYGSLNTTARR